MQGLLPILLLIWVIAGAVSKAKKGAGKSAAAKPAARPAAAQRQTPSVQMNRPVPSMKRQTPTVARSAQRNFSAPDAPCIVCEQTGEDHFQRDKARRIAQLDDWLKNGLIDKNEYRVMKDRYERGI